MVNTTLGCVQTILNCEQTMARSACVNFYKCNMYLLGYLNAAFSYNLIFADAPEPWQYGFQDPATPVMEGIVDLHHDICFFSYCDSCICPLDAQQNTFLFSSE